MRGQGGGLILNVASAASFVPQSFAPVYGASKGLWNLKLMFFSPQLNVAIFFYITVETIGHLIKRKNSLKSTRTSCSIDNFVVLTFKDMKYNIF